MELTLFLNKFNNMNHEHGRFREIDFNDITRNLLKRYRETPRLSNNITPKILNN